jgi:uncharacterized protein involved in propanediol utilization
MAKNEYKGKRIMVTMPVEVFESLEKLAKADTRSNSQAALVLILEGLKRRNLLNDESSD